MNIEYARLIPTPIFNYKKEDQNKILNENYKALLFEYDIIYQRIVNSERKLKEVFQSKKCFCGGTLKYIKKYDFWGCSDYLTLEKHITFSGLEPNYKTYETLVDANWVTDIIKKLGFSGKLKAKELFQFYIDNGLQDLREFCGLTPTSKRINGFIETNKRSKEQEKECLSYLKNIYPTVVYQQCISYKVIGEKEKFCIPDFICSNKNYVHVIDAKLNYADNEKMKMYIDLVTFILRKKADNRPVKGSHIMYNENNSLQIYSL